MTETSWSVELESVYAELLPNDTLERALQDNLDVLGPVPFDEADLATAARFRQETLTEQDIATANRSIGAADPIDTPLHPGVLPLDTTRLLIHGSTDVADVSWVVPTAQISTACIAFGTPYHSWQLVGQGKVPAAHKGLAHAAKVMAAAAAQLIGDPELPAQARAEQTERTAATPYELPFPPGVVPPRCASSRHVSTPTDGEKDD